ncbi:MAG: cytochrome c [Rhizobiales bacterium]|nr:cytochrome c [Hyphomicrobiales bacterium]
MRFLKETKMKKYTLLVAAVIILFLIAKYYIQDDVARLDSSQSPLVLSDFGQGKVLFDDNCAACHGKGAVGVEGAGPTFLHKVYEPNHHGDASFYRAAQYGVRAHHWPYGNMPPQTQVSQTDVKKIIAYIRKLQKDKGIY